MDLQDLKDATHGRLLRSLNGTGADDNGGCWLAACHKNPSGEAVISVENKLRTVARVAYWVYRGDSESFDLDGPDRLSKAQKGCAEGCVNPWHRHVIRSRAALAAA